MIYHVATWFMVSLFVSGLFGIPLWTSLAITFFSTIIYLTTKE